MRKFAVIFCFTFLAGCATITDKPVEVVCTEEKIEEILKDRAKLRVELIKFNRSLITPPLDLDEFKNIKAKVFMMQDKPYITFTPEEYGQLLVLLNRLGNRMKEQEVQIYDILEFYEQQLD